MSRQISTPDQAQIRRQVCETREYNRQENRDQGQGKEAQKEADDEHRWQEQGRGLISK